MLQRFLQLFTFYQLNSQFLSGLVSFSELFLCMVDRKLLITTVGQRDCITLGSIPSCSRRSMDDFNRIASSLALCSSSRRAETLSLHRCTGFNGQLHFRICTCYIPQLVDDIHGMLLALLMRSPFLVKLNQFGVYISHRPSCVLSQYRRSKELHFSPALTAGGRAGRLEGICVTRHSHST